MRASRIALLVIIAIFSAYMLCALYAYLRPPPPFVDKGEFPEFSAILVDNGENDYVDLWYIKPGTEAYRTEDNEFFPRTEIWVEGDNLFFTKEIFNVRFSLGDKTRVFFDADVVHKGKFYHVIVVDMAARIDNVRCE